ncbi:signal peptidase II [Haloechinothrix sp. LS1_15]|uniref:signal peptidase II n=1 Tax=Haloechinothrix sp. LS1_15 TaxID=2652248 RepID=UPI00294A9E46|nr:signal peptidase II [Haloechinothrix sp. LS1_15]
MTSEQQPPRRIGWVAAVAAIVMVADVVTKVVAVAMLEGAEPVPVLGGVAYLQLVRNPGAAFSMASGVTWLLALIAIGVVVAIIWISRHLRSRVWALALGGVLGGALGNLTDRLFREPGVFQGHVVDFVSLFAPDGRIWPVFNVADAAIVVGAVTVVVLTLLGRDYDGRRDGGPEAAQTGTDDGEGAADPAADGGTGTGATTESSGEGTGNPTEDTSGGSRE